MNQQNLRGLLCYFKKTQFAHRHQKWRHHMSLVEKENFLSCHALVHLVRNVSHLWITLYGAIVNQRNKHLNNVSGETLVLVLSLGTSENQLELVWWRIEFKTGNNPTEDEILPLKGENDVHSKRLLLRTDSLKSRWNNNFQKRHFHWSLWVKHNKPRNSHVLPLVKCAPPNQTPTGSFTLFWSAFDDQFSSCVLQIPISCISPTLDHTGHPVKISEMFRTQITWKNNLCCLLWFTEILFRKHTHQVQKVQKVHSLTWFQVLQSVRQIGLVEIIPGLWTMFEGVDFWRKRCHDLQNQNINVIAAVSWVQRQNNAALLGFLLLFCVLWARGLTPVSH